jgi:hypothetical protein
MPSVSLAHSFASNECTSVEAFSSTEFRLTSSSGYWQCGICGTTPIITGTGFEFTMPDPFPGYSQFAIGLDTATRACQNHGLCMDHYLKFEAYGLRFDRRECTTGSIQSINLYGNYVATDVFGMALHNNKVYFFKNGVVISESGVVPDIEYRFDYSTYYQTTRINVTFVDALAHWDTLN